MPRFCLSRKVLLASLWPLTANAFHAPVSRALSDVRICTNHNISHNENPPSTGNTSLDNRRVVIIGAGVGGLSCAARIAAETKKWNEDVEIVVIEKNSRNMLGGRCGSFSVNIEGVGRFRHERGPSLLLLKHEYESLFADCTNFNKDDSDSSTAAEKYGLKMKQCIPAYQVVFDDGDTVDVGFPRSKCAGESITVEEIKQIQQLEQKSIQQLNSIEPDGYQKWQEYLNTCAAYLDCGLPNFIEERLDLSTLPKFLAESLRENAKRWPLQPHSSMLSKLFTSPKMIALASFQDLYVGLEPYANSNEIGGGVLRKSAPAVFGLLGALELHPTNPKCGVFAPVGGFRQVAESMHQLCIDSGVKFIFDTSVTRVDNNGVHVISKGSGCELEANYLPADLIICNEDLPVATQTIMSDKRTPVNEERYDWDDRFDFSTGVVAFHWSVSKELDALNTHNVFLSAKNSQDAEKSWSVLRSNDGNELNGLIVQPFNFYVHRASKTDLTAAPPGCDAIMVLVPCRTLQRNKDLASVPREEAINIYKQQFHNAEVSSMRKAVFARLAVLEGLQDLHECILDEVVDTPGTYADYYNVGAGVPFGLSHGLGQLSLTRPGAESPSHNSVLYVGASSRPGNGVPLVLIGAKSVSHKTTRMLTQKFDNFFVRAK